MLKYLLPVIFAFSLINGSERPTKLRKASSAPTLQKKTTQRATKGSQLFAQLPIELQKHIVLSSSSSLGAAATLLNKMRLTNKRWQEVTQSTPEMLQILSRTFNCGFTLAALYLGSPEAKKLLKEKITDPKIKATTFRHAFLEGLEHFDNTDQSQQTLLHILGRIKTPAALICRLHDTIHTVESCEPIKITLAQTTETASTQKEVIFREILITPAVKQILSTGKQIIMAVSSGQWGSNFTSFVVRLNPDASIDTSFADEGFLKFVDFDISSLTASGDHIFLIGQQYGFPISHEKIIKYDAQTQQIASGEIAAEKHDNLKFVDIALDRNNKLVVLSRKYRFLMRNETYGDEVSLRLFDTDLNYLAKHIIYKPTVAAYIPTRLVAQPNGNFVALINSYSPHQQERLNIQLIGPNFEPLTSFWVKTK